MLSIRSILRNQPKVSDKTIATQGFCIWICWSDYPESQVAKMLGEAGGIEISKTSQQSLWFFFSVEVALYALVKIDSLGKQFLFGVTSFAFPAKLLVGAKQILAVEVDPSFADITTPPPVGSPSIFIHPAVRSYAVSLPNLTFYDTDSLEKQGLFGWKIVVIEKRMAIYVEQGWYAFLHPIGNPLDKQFQRGWEKIFTSIEPLLVENKFKYSLHNGFLSVAITTIKDLRIWVGEAITVFNEIRELHQDLYWPCLSVIMGKKNLSFTPDLQERLGIDWDSLCPDTTYLNYKDALLLGDGFIIDDMHYSSALTDVTSLCTVSSSSFDAIQSTLNPLPAKMLLPAQTLCFYCGCGSHDAINCPSKFLAPVKENFWKDLTNLDIGVINSSYALIDAAIVGGGVEAYSEILDKDDSTSDLIIANFAINSFLQAPNISRIWQISSRNMDEVPSKVIPQKEPAWNILKRFTQKNQDLFSIERDCVSHISRDPKDWRLQCLKGFISMEKNDFGAAMQAWRKAENICTTTTHQVWLRLLVARIKEIQGLYDEALGLYTQAQALLPTWKDLDYRINVCLVKKGFGRSIAKKMVEQISESPEIFHKIILDLELQRGRFDLLKTLIPEWDREYNLFVMDQMALTELFQTLKDWFEETDSPMMYYGEKIKTLLESSKIKNYLIFLELSHFKGVFETDLIRVIEQETNILKQDYETCLAKVESIRDEMTWFYFQKALISFNANFNDCATILNWAFISNFNDVNTYKEARIKLPKLQELIVKLKGNLRQLRIVRDVTLFLLLMVKTFVRTAIVLIVLACVSVFVLLFFGSSFGMPWAQSFIAVNFWGILKVVLSISFMLSFGLASLKTTISFDKKRNKLLTVAKEERIKGQQKRVLQAKQRRSDEQAKIKRRIQK